MQQLLVALPDLQPEAKRGWEVMEYWPDYSDSFLPGTAHPDITDRFGRVWVWYHEDTYIHDGDTACLKKFIPTDNERTA